MKTIIAIAIAAFTFAAAPASQASDCYRASYSYTKTIGCRTECRWTTNSCGRRYSYEVKVVSYADYYTDGSRRTYTRRERKKSAGADFFLHSLAHALAPSL